MKANIIEVFILLDLLLLTALFLDSNSQNLDAVRTIASILLLIPFIFIVLYIGAMLFSYVWSVYNINLCPTYNRACQGLNLELFHSWFSI